MTGPLRLTLLLFSLFLGQALGQTPDSPTRTPEQWVAELGHSSFSRREKASLELWKMGEDARPALEAALKSNQDEVVRRAKQILAKFDSGNLPNIAPELKVLIDKFREGNEASRLTTVRELCRYGDGGPTTLRRLIQKEIQQPEVRIPFYANLSRILREEVPILILQGQLGRAEALLELNTWEPTSPGLLDYAVLCARTSRGKAAAEKLEQRKAEAGPIALAARKTLVYLYRATGELTKAKQNAAEIEKVEPTYRSVHNSLLEDAEAWAELAGRGETGEVNSRDGLRIFHLRMAGQKDEAAKLANLQKDQGLDSDSYSGRVDAATLALMLNNRPLDGLDRLQTQGSAPHILADLLATRLRFREALDIVSNRDKGDEASAFDRSMLRQLYGTRRGRLLWQLGERDAAAQVFSKLAQEITGGPENRDGRPYTDFTVAQLVRTEVRSGRYDLACEHLGTSLAVSGYDGQRPRYYGQDAFELIFDQDADVAAYWWRILREHRPDGETAGSTMQKIRRLLTGQATEAERTKAIQHALKDGGPPRRRPSRDGRRDEPFDERTEDPGLKPLAIASLYRAHGQLPEAVAGLKAQADRWPKRVTEPDQTEDALFAELGMTNSRSWIFGIDERFRFWIELGDMLLELGQPKEAAQRYYEGWTHNPANGLLLYLSGRALLKAGAGDESEGKKRITASHLVSLGNARMRGRFLEELITRGYANDVRQEIELIRLCGWVSELHIGNVWNQVARGSILLKEFGTAAMAHNRAIHYLLRTPGVSYVEGYAYLTVPQAVRVSEARQLIAANQIAEGVALAKECLTIIPGNNDLTIGIVPALDQKGHKAEADALFQMVWKAYSEIITQHPQSAWARSQAAWLAAGCRRELDTALKYATKAVELDPNMRSFQETLAEVHFRRGERKEAIELMKALIRFDRRSFSYKRQLERYQNGDFDSPILETDD